MENPYESPYGYYLERLVIDAKAEKAGVGAVIHRASADKLIGLALPRPTGILITTSDFPYDKTFVAYGDVRGISHR